MKKKPSAAQIAARKKFAEMAKARAGKKKPAAKKPRKKAAKKSPAKRVVKAAPAKRKTARKPARKWFAVYALVGGKKYYDTGTGKLVASKVKAERFATIDIASAAARNIAKRLRVAHSGIYAEPATAPK